MRRLLCAFACLLFAAAAVAQPVDWRERAQTAIHMLDYVGVDYPEFVRDGKVLDEEEYQEQLEFTQQVVAILQELPENPRRAALVAAAERLAQAVTAKAPGAEVSEASGTLRRAIMDAYELAAAPKQAPDAARGAALYAELCAACHGAEGRGDGPAGKGLEPPPSDFHDAARMASRSVYGLYNTITLGVAGTGMAAYNQLSEDDRWALAFHVSRFALNDADLARAEAAWRSGEHAGTFSSLREVVSLSTEEVRARHGDAAALAHLWLRAHPEALAEGRPSPLRFAAQALRESDAAYRAGERERAHQLAITAYLEGFELVEASLDNVDAALRATVEREMMTHRTLMKSGAAPEAVAAQTARVLELLEAAREKLEAGALSPGATFAASFLILLREGFEAILVLAAIVTFLVKSGRRDALPWVHAGWAAALLLGAATWFAATHLIDISGADRELTEGITA
ncbi:MAG TPA: c-type cytochrome, partial [Burkholderiales bacterium]